MSTHCFEASMDLSCFHLFLHIYYGQDSTMFQGQDFAKSLPLGISLNFSLLHFLPSNTTCVILHSLSTVVLAESLS